VSIIPQIVFLCILLTLSAFFSGSESALFSLPGSTTERFAQSKKRRERNVAQLLGNRQALLVSILIGNLVVNLAATGRATELLVETLGDQAGSWIAWIGMTIIILVLGEITPKIIAVQHAALWATRVASTLRLYNIVIYPIRRIIVQMLSPLVSRWGVEHGHRLVERAELRTAIEEGSRIGELHGFESDIIFALLDIEEIRVKEIMTPRVNIEAIPSDTALDTIIRGAWRMRRTRFPVYEGSVDNIVGILHFKDVAANITDARKKRAGSIMRDALYVPWNLSVAGVLIRFHSEKKDLAVVVDEYGAVAGLVTLQDIIDEGFGPLPDRHDPATPVLTPVKENRWLIPATFPLDELSKKLGVDLDDPDVETIGGLVCKVAGRIPLNGDEIRLADTVMVRIRHAEARRIRDLFIQVEGRDQV